MKGVREYALIVPIALAVLISAYGAYSFLSASIASNDLQKEIAEQNLYKQMIRELQKEHDASLLYAYNKNEQNAQNLAKERAKTDAIAANIAQYMPAESDQPEQLSQRLEQIRQSSDSGEQNMLFLSFFERITMLMSQNYLRYESEPISEQLKIYLFALNSLYENLNTSNTSRAHVLQALQNHAVVTQENIKRWLNPASINLFSTDVLPRGEAKIRLQTLLNSETTQHMLRNFDELRLGLSNYGFSEISRENVMALDAFEEQKFTLLLEISDIVEAQLAEDNQKYYNEVHTKFILASALLALLCYCWTKIYNRLNLASALQEHINHIRHSILEHSDAANSSEQVLAEFIAIYKELFGKHQRLKSFERIKNTHLNKLIKGYKSKFKQNLQSINFLRSSFAALDQNQALNALEQNTSVTVMRLENLKSIIEIEDSDLRLNLGGFDPQALFKGVLEAKNIEIAAKKINYITFIDPRLNRELEGDESKLRLALANLISSAISLCNQYAQIIVEISCTTTASGDIAHINASVRNNASLLEPVRIEQLLGASASVSFERDEEDIELWLAMANMYLKLMGSKLEIKSSQGLGNEFGFKISLKSRGGLNLEPVDKRIKIGVVGDANTQYNAFLARTLEGLGISFERISSLKNLAEPEKYGFILMRESKELPRELENLIILKDPLTPLKVLQKLSKDPSARYLQKFMLIRPQILIYEPNEIVAQMIKRAFSGYNVDLLTHTQLQNALEALTNKKFDLVFVGISGGFEQAKELATTLKLALNSGQNTATPVVAMSSNTSSISQNEAATLFDEHIKKPLVSRQLRSTLDKFIPNMKNFIKTNGALAKNQNILLCKKSEIENRLFAAALSELRGKVATANTFKELTESLQREQFGLILVDEEISGYSSDVLAAIIESLRENFAIDARLFVFSNESHSAGAKDYIKTLSPHISKAQLISVLRHEISDMGGGMRAL